MSFNAKNLTYELKEPAFLRKLKQNYSTSDPVRHEHQINRPKRPRADDEDDGPTYVDEESNDVLTKAEYEELLRQSNVAQIDEQALVKGDVDKTIDKPEEAGEETSDGLIDLKAKENVASVGARVKKRAVMAVGDSEPDPDLKTEQEPRKAPEKAKQKKGKKKVKLSFDDN